MKAITDQVAWRFIVPRPRYFRNLMVARRIPEIKAQINRQAFLKGAEYGFYALLSPAILVMLALFAIYWALDMLLKPGRFPIMPPFDELQHEAVEEAWSIVPFDVIQERLGEQTRILSKKGGLQ